MSADMVELAYLRYVLINGGQDIESSNDVLAICQRIAELEKRIKGEKYHAKSFQRFLLESLNAMEIQPQMERCCVCMEIQSLIKIWPIPSIFMMVVFVVPQLKSV